MLIGLKEETKGAGAYFDHFAWKNFEPRDTVQVVFFNPGVRIPGEAQFFNTEEMFDLHQGEFSGTFRIRKDRRVKESSWRVRGVRERRRIKPRGKRRKAGR